MELLQQKKANFFCVAFKSTNSKDQDYSKADMLISDFEAIKYDKVRDLFN
jgi:hypothetical protein